jgi:type I restriction enzyme R subunit
VEGFHKKDELELFMQRRSSRQSLASAAINAGIAGRSYQQQAIRSVTEAIEQHNQRRSLVVMATGAGKTRTVIALVDLLVQCNWAKRVLFLADRVSLVKQATKAFIKFAPNLGVVNLLDNADSQGRVYVSTYPTMLNLINDTSSDGKRFGIGYFDVVIVDEAHRSIYAKYGALFSYFDSYLIGLTATPKDEVDRNTYGLFELQKGVPTYAYSLEEAIADGYLVKPNAVSVPLKFIREGIKYKDLSEDEQQQWDELDWGDDEPPEQIDSAALNQWLFNEATVDKVLAHLMTKGEKVASGDRLGKTIIFAKNNRHAEFIAERFNENYKEYKGHFARVITFKTEYAQSLIDDFSVKDKLPHIAISVDMLDTGIDVPEVVNLVFFKLVRSKTKFWQMIGRGTRLCPDLYAPGQHKQLFNIFDYCQNIEYFNGDLPVSDPPIPESLDSRLFQARVGLLLSLDGESSEDKIKNQKAPYEAGLREDTARLLHEIVAYISLDNFIVRPKRKYVEKFSQREAWDSLNNDEAMEMANQLSALPSQRRDSEEEAKRFDLMILRAQLCILQSNPGFDRLKQAIMDIAGALELQESIPAIRKQMPLIQSLLTDDWWQDVTVGMLEHVRRQLRLLVKLIEKTKRPIIFTDFEDEIGDGTAIDLPLKPVGLDYERFKNKTRDFLREHEDRLAIQKLRRNLPITQSDLDELEKILLEQAANNNDFVQKARDEAGGLGLFVRSLVGLERNAAVETMSEFINDSTATASQLTFIKLIVECLTSNGIISDDLFYQSPFTDYAPTGPEGIFSADKITQLNELIQDIRQRAVA